jgi:hypothetical protein
MKLNSPQRSPAAAGSPRATPAPARSHWPGTLAVAAAAFLAGMVLGTSYSGGGGGGCDGSALLRFVGVSGGGGGVGDEGARGASGSGSSALIDAATAPRRRTAPARAVVVASIEDDTVWLLRELPDLCLMPYAHLDNASVAHAWEANPNRGREASVYLRFILDHYDNLPDRTLFLHGHGVSWHGTNVVEVIRHLDWGLQYANLNYNPEYEVFTEAEDAPDTGLRGMWQSLEKHWPELWAEVTGLPRPPPRVRFHCCAQFMLSRELIRSIPRAWYQKALDWVHGGEERFPGDVAHAAIMMEFTVSSVCARTRTHRLPRHGAWGVSGTLLSARLAPTSVRLGLCSAHLSLQWEYIFFGREFANYTHCGEAGGAPDCDVCAVVRGCVNGTGFAKLVAGNFRYEPAYLDTLRGSYPCGPWDDWPAGLGPAG